MTKRHPSHPPVHPGEILAEDVYPSLGITKDAFAAALGVSRQTLHQIMTLARPVSTDMALRLEAVVGSRDELWLSMQAEYDLSERRRMFDKKGLKRLRPAA